jgi:hypothetical protein
MDGLGFMYKTKLHLISILIMLCVTGVASSEPSLRFSPSEIDIGTRMTGEKVIVHTLVVNKGSKVVHIKAIKSSCGCIVPKSAVSSLQPGQSLKLEIEVEGLGIEGSLRKNVWIFTNKPDKHVYPVKIRGEFKSATHQLFSSSRFINLGTVVQGETIRRSIGVYRTGLVPVGVLRFSPPAKWLQTTTVGGRDAKVVNLQMTLRIPKGIQSIKEEIVLHGAEPNDFLRIPVKGRVIPRIRVSPTAVMIEEKKLSYRLRVFLENNEEAPKLIRHVFDGDGLALEGVESVLRQRSQPWVVARIRSESGEGDFAKGRLLLYFEDQNQPAEVLFVKPRSN